MPIGAAIGGASASLIGNGIASGEQATASKNALNYQKQIRTDIQPYMTAGTDALSRISDPNKMAANYVQSPGYQWALSQGENAVTTNKATNELLRSGSAMEGLNNYAQGAASQDFNNWWNQQYDVANLGKSAEGVAAGVADNSSSIAQQAGTNAANSTIAASNNVGNLAGSLAQLFQNPNTGGSSSYTSLGSPGTAGASATLTMPGS